MKIKIALSLIALAAGAYLSLGFFDTQKEVKEDHVITTTAEINWVTIEEAEKLALIDNKKILVDMYTDWCGWCKRMDKDTYAKVEVANYINEHYHAVKFNAEQKGDITLGGRTFKHLPDAGRNGTHELALAMLGNKLSYPTTVFFDEKLQKLTNVPGYLKPADIMPILTYFADDVHKSGKDFQIHAAEYGKTK